HEVCKDRIFGLEVADLEVAEVVPHTLEPRDFLVIALTNLGHVLLSRGLGTTTLVSLRAFSFERSEILLCLLLTLSDSDIALVGECLELETQFCFELCHVFVAALFIDVDDHVRSEVDDLLE